MAKVRILKRQEKAYIELPQEMAGLEEIELFQLKEGYYLLTIPLQQAKKQENGQLSEEEKGVIRRLLAVRFENRTPAYVAKALSAQELETLKELERRGLVNVFRGQKYVDGVYNIKDSAYALAQKETGAAAAKPQLNSNPTLAGQGFRIVQDKREAMMLSEQLAQEMKNGSVIGVKGFDGKFYIVTRDYFVKGQERVAKVLKGDMDAAMVSTAAQIEPEGCMAILRIMAENGEIIERKKGIFAPV